jgi:pimeloyl-ACP methyl ester carboxylesterase
MLNHVTRVLITSAVAVTGLAAHPASLSPQDAFPPPGRLIDVGGYRLHVFCAGNGSPTVLIDGGAGAWSIHFSHIQAALAGEMRVCTYDRAGLGWSDEGPSPRTSGQMVDELHRLLHEAGVRPPLLLVGHSLGGYNVRIYQHRYPEEVAGLILVDAAHEGQWERLPPEWAAGVRALVPALRARAEQARSGAISRADVEPGAFTAHAPQWRAAHVAAQLAPKMYLGMAAENDAAFESARQVPSGRLGALPLVVLTARRSFDAFAGSGLDVEPANRIWLQLQHELAHLSSKTVHLFSERDHNLPASDPDAVVAAIRRGAGMIPRSGPAPAASCSSAVPPTAPRDRRVPGCRPARRAGTGPAARSS